ncbi:hypothetical protein OHS33_30585 [Streptomyces sp. NBC_00536]|uniref:hypothetical protein n=1 Tax=Streptomyces sp. NBC_00536 TaxID=2975769 RepID=UPI002E7FF2CA|nr:hypothetical protein [Streptomyces sp. NBC_00536]WUC82316.1 hypothetical protein OHS33_30585 [Streptomyces sp. NBC_00536]
MENGSPENVLTTLTPTVRCNGTPPTPALREGQWRLETVLPAVYPGRTRHVHVKVQPPGGSVLTTMLYFPGERRNHLDKYFRPECLMNARETPEGWDAEFTFVLDV